MTDITQAILALDPGAQASVTDNDQKKITWDYGNPKKNTKKQMMAKRDELEVAINSLQFQRSRQPEYPPVGDQLDEFYHAGIFQKNG